MVMASRSYQRLKGPVVPLNICFNADRTVDFDATGRYVDWLCAQQVPVVMLTYGSSEFAWLTQQDIFDLTARVGRAVAGRSMFIASTGFWPARTSRDFLKQAQDSGADAVKVQITMWEPLSGALLRGYFDRLEGAAEMPLLLYYNPGSAAATIAPNVLSEICALARRSNIIGIKNDGHPFYDYYDMIRGTAGQEFAVISGGQMRNFLFGYPLGSPAYLCPIAPFRPDLALEFYRHVREDRLDQARDLVFRYEEPLLAFAATVNWLLFMKTAIGLLGFYPTPTLGTARDVPCGDEESTRIRAFLKTAFGLDKA